MAAACSRDCHTSTGVGPTYFAVAAATVTATAGAIIATKVCSLSTTEQGRYEG